MPPPAALAVTARWRRQSRRSKCARRTSRRCFGALGARRMPAPTRGASGPCFPDQRDSIDSKRRRGEDETGRLVGAGPGRPAGHVEPRDQFAGADRARPETHGHDLRRDRRRRDVVRPFRRSVAIDGGQPFGTHRPNLASRRPAAKFRPAETASSTGWPEEDHHVVHLPASAAEQRVPDGVVARESARSHR